MSSTLKPYSIFHELKLFPERCENEGGISVLQDHQQHFIEPHTLQKKFSYIYCGVSIFITAYLTSTQENYNSILEGALESPRRFLLETHLVFQQSKILHPKLSKLLNIVARLSEVVDVSHKRMAAIITHTFPDKVNVEIEEMMSCLQGVKVNLYKSVTDLNEFQGDVKLSVYLINALHLDEDFPWDSFDFVLDYDSNVMNKREGILRSARLKDYVTFITVPRAIPHNEPTLQSNGKCKSALICVKEF